MTVITIKKMEETNLYERLGLKSDASSEEIKRAYKKSVRCLYPSHDPPDLAEKRRNRNNLMVEAFEILMAPDLRRIYDEKGFDKCKEAMAEVMKKNEGEITASFSYFFDTQ